jgi:hypothetical protein
MELEKTGCGGLPDQDVRVEVSMGEAGYITSMVQWLDEMGLAIHLPGLIYNSPYAQWVRISNPEGRTKARNPHLAMEGEVDRPGNRGQPIPLRVGQNWVVEGGVLEITSILDRSVEGVRWSGLGKRLVEGAVLTQDAPLRVSSVPMDALRKCTKIGLMENIPKRAKSKARRVKRLLERKPTNPTLSVPSYAGNSRVLSLMKYIRMGHGRRG